MTQRCEGSHHEHRGQGAVLNLPVPEHEAEREPLNCVLPTDEKSESFLHLEKL